VRGVITAVQLYDATQRAGGIVPQLDGVHSRKPSRNSFCAILRAENEHVIDSRVESAGGCDETRGNAWR
jgi:hypothetical protein